MVKETKKIERENEDYEYINGKLYIRATSLIRAITGILHKDDYEELLEQGLGFDEKGERI